jgi:hypothetical protein
MPLNPIPRLRKKERRIAKRPGSALGGTGRRRRALLIAVGNSWPPSPARPMGANFPIRPHSGPERVQVAVSPPPVKQTS